MPHARGTRPAQEPRHFRSFVNPLWRYLRMTTSPTLRVAFYARVSSDHQAEEGTIASQVAALRQRIAADDGQTGQVSALAGAPYGYRYVGKQAGGGQARYEVVAEQARVVQQIFAWVARERVSLRAVCRRLAEQGVPSPSGQPRWSPATIAYF